MYLISSECPIDIICQTIINIEHGKRIFVNGKRVSNPQPLIVKNTGYCNVTIMPTYGAIYFATSSDQNRHNMICDLVNRIELNIHKYEQSNICTEVEHGNISKSEFNIIPRSLYDTSSIEVNNSMYKREFYKHSLSDNSNINFKWIINDCIVDLASDNHIHNFIQSKVGIVIDYSGLLCKQHIKEVNIDSYESLLHTCGINTKKIRKTYISGELFIAPLSAPKLTHETRVHYDIYDGDTDKFDHMKMKGDIVCVEQACQICGSLLYECFDFYSVGHNKIRAFCRYCSQSTKFRKIKGDKAVYSTFHARTLKDVCESVFGITYDIYRDLIDKNIHIIDEYMSLNAVDRIICTNVNDNRYAFVNA